uniref:transcription initiation factor TFIID subunit 4-like n=1 Tax=Panthera onca TaxID=9690 RepID=UPI0029552436|nr:transcription initiation factor TFIID subunit 4-like [Panthera onca]XP_060476660.1 transcription initiation factor TFIID subunit 4-like [Panthera onca]XP_060476661.1 transcription initiation factor TFIID subunit 4-like [Panthera onca]
MAPATRPGGPRSGHLPINANNPRRAGPQGSRFPASNDSRPPCPPSRPGAVPRMLPGRRRGVPHRSRVRNRTCQSLLSAGPAGGSAGSAAPAAASATAPRPSAAPTPEGRQGPGGAEPGPVDARLAGRAARDRARPRAIRPRRLPSSAGPGPGAHAGLRAEAGAAAPRPAHKAAPREPASPAARGAAGLREPSDPAPARASQPRPPGAAWRRRRRRHFHPLAVASSPLSGYSIHLGLEQPAPRRASASTPPARACGDCAEPGSPAARARPAATAHSRLKNPTGARAAPSAPPRSARPRSPRAGMRASL